MLIQIRRPLKRWFPTVSKGRKHTAPCWDTLRVSRVGQELEKSREATVFTVVDIGRARQGLGRIISVGSWAEELLLLTPAPGVIWAPWRVELVLDGALDWSVCI